MSDTPADKTKPKPSRRGGRKARLPDRTAVVSHEFRGPLGVITALTELLLTRPLETPDRHAVELIRLAGHHLMAIADDLVAEARIGVETFSVRPATFSPADTLRAIAALYAPLTVGTSRSLEIEIDPGVPAEIRSDEGRIRQILFNLVSNASKATTSGRITLALRPSDDGLGVVFDVIDDGPGLPEGFVPAPFRHETPDGNGLGLWISVQIAETLRGNLALTNRPEGGALARLTIPATFAEEPAAPDPEPEPEPRPAADPAPRTASRPRAARAGKSASRAARRPDGETVSSPIAGRHVLLVDDAPVSRMLLAAVLQSFDMTFDAASASEDALAFFHVRRPDVILTDWTLAHETGASVIEALRTAGDEPLPPVIVLTGSPRSTVPAGAGTYLRKPFTPRELFECLKGAFGFAPAAESVDGA